MPPALRNLAKVGELVEHETDAAQVLRMLEAIRQNIQDGRSGTVSVETRFEAAYRAIMPRDHAMGNGGALGKRLPSIEEHARAPHDFDPDVAGIQSAFTSIGCACWIRSASSEMRSIIPVKRSMVNLWRNVSMLPMILRRHFMSG